MRKIVFLFVLICELWTICGLWSITCGLTYAAEGKTSPCEKLGRGLVNTTTGWMEVPVEIFKQTQDKGHLAGLIAAPVTGVFKAIGRTLIGVYEVISSPFAQNEPIIKPEYIWQRMD